ncbi:uncharacterized protein LOC110856763 [Folsomia candida]|uniref:uncharacterized protein LOC110856763 n=1 Tax=Folsomia candida TaxID=158441 RepID=UPI000B9006F9|nr:uncharacterized protein LOC110856763 [Folsomia candida]XP_035713297.1 uncharacterized protein LOC110856763 [Folsomia candida]
MRWSTVLFLVVGCLVGLACANPLSRSRRQATSTTTEKSTTGKNATSGEDDIVDVLRALNLPDDFADTKKPTPTTTTVGTTPTTTAKSITTTTTASTPKAEAKVGSGDTNSIDSSQSRVARQYFMTGNAMLDKVMNCPCQKDQLDSMGVNGVPYSNQPNPAIYRDPPYGPDALGPGDVIATNLKSVGGTTGNVFGQLIRLMLGLPNLALSLLKPLVVGAADTLAQTTDAAAGVTQQAAKTLPVAVRSGAVVLKKLLETVGDVTGGLLHVLSNLVASLAAAKTSLSGTLPFAFDILGDVSGRVSQTVGTAVDWVAGTKEILASGVVQAAKTGGNLFSGLVEGTKGFSTGLLEGIKYGVNDETPPPSEQAWRR